MSLVDRRIPCAPRDLTPEQRREWVHAWNSPQAAGWRLSRHEQLLRRLCVLRALTSSTKWERGERRAIEARLGLAVVHPEPVPLPPRPPRPRRVSVGGGES